jgi:cyclic beta-1,2-glucan synthetase
MFSDNRIQGVSDSVRLLKKSFDLLPRDRRSSNTLLDSLSNSTVKLEEMLKEVPASNLEKLQHWQDLQTQAASIYDIATVLASDRGDDEAAEFVEWARLVLSDIQGHTRELGKLLPFLTFLGDAPQVFKFSADDQQIWRSVEERFSNQFSLSDIPRSCTETIESLEHLRNLRRPRMAASEVVFFDEYLEALELAKVGALEILERFRKVADSAKRIFYEMDFTFLFNQKKKLFSIGYRVLEDELDQGSYDLLASEARLMSYVAIIKGDVPVSHWFRLGRALTPVDGGAVLISWSGSMFEYLMPSLVMFNPLGSLLDQTCRLVVKRQIQYGQSRHVPWGISESAYNVRDLHMTYQYSNFGVPGLGLKRGLANDLVIAPYASALASMFDPQSALENFESIEHAGGLGAYGFYEAMDYTSSRLRENQKAQVVRSYMAHHQGMALLSFSNVLFSGKMRNRFHSEPLAQAAELLLQERTPRNIASVKSRLEEVDERNVRDMVPPVIRRLTSPHHPIPSSHLLSNGRYAVMATAAGGGYSRWKNLAITRWREDVTCDSYGSYLYLRDLKSEFVWSATYHPTRVSAESSEMIFSEDRVKIARQDDSISSSLEIIVSPEDDAELRRLSLTNTGSETREIEITSYAEVVLAPADTDRAHPSFSNLFIETEYLTETATLLATRRPRKQNDAKPYMAQVLSVDGHAFGETEYETDRARFIGRGRTLKAPQAIVEGRPLSKSVGAVLDPILSLRVKVRITPGATAKICFTTLAAEDREGAILLAEKYRNPAAFERSSTLAWTQAQVRLHYLGTNADEAQVFQKLANRVIYSDPMMRPASEILKRNRLNVTGLWGRGISGDLPIILVRIDDEEDQALVRQLLRAHEYWRMKKLAVDIVVLNEKASSYVQDLQNSLETLVRGSLSEGTEGPQGKVFVLRNDLLNQKEKELLLTVSRAILDSRQGSLAEQVMKMRKVEPLRELPSRSLVESVTVGLRDRLREGLRDTLKAALDYAESGGKREVEKSTRQLDFFNGIGGFDSTRQEYSITQKENVYTPAPWVNVISNQKFGFQVSESGSGYTWSLNSRENQMTSWSNDSVLDPPSEAIYLTNLDSGVVWSPTASPVRVKDATYTARHGRGYSTFECKVHGIKSELTQYVSWNDSVKISRLTLENLSRDSCKLSVTGYVEWVLGFSRMQTAPYIVTEWDASYEAILAENPLNIEFGERVAFFAFQQGTKSHSGNRSEFIGRNGGLDSPAALVLNRDLSGKVGAGLDPCGAIQTELVIAPGEKKEIYLLLGQAENREVARELLKKYKHANLSDSLTEVVSQWNQILNKVQVKTPDPAMNTLLNSWLLYQTIACRFWARAAFYQAGGAYGFRDQLQDVMAMVVGEPKLCRQHILRASSRQFLEGDVQHWWHPPSGRGVRTHFSDDLLWLPYTVVHYLSVTCDESILDETTPFIEGPLLTQEQEDSYFEPRVSLSPPGTLFEHCARALDRSLATGEHGLPLMGTGDWNDGMNRVGHLGKGESVWVGWFLYATLKSFIPIAIQRGEKQRAETWEAHASKLRTAIEEKAWDGEWYIRAFFDDGTPLGSHANAECKIDSIAQTWAILSGAGDPTRAKTAMRSVEKNLIRSQEQLILLFTPPFDHTKLDPGYIKGYVPGVRENGGQYTHAAVWCVCAYAASGDGKRARELFSMLNPVEHAATRAGVQTYKVEPYVIAADIYGKNPHVGRGGWTWYTGSSGWMYRAGIEYILGILPHGDFLELNPCVDPDWKEFTVCFRHDTERGSTMHEIQFENPKKVSRGIRSISVDGIASGSDRGFKLLDDQKNHQVKVVLG